MNKLNPRTVCYFFLTCTETRKKKPYGLQKTEGQKLLQELLIQTFEFELALSSDLWMGAIFIVYFNAFTDSRPVLNRHCCAHFSLTDLGILPNIWFSQRNKQKKECNCTRTLLFPPILLRITTREQTKSKVRLTERWFRSMLYLCNAKH